jgi:hypothetical protein
MRSHNESGYSEKKIALMVGALSLNKELVKKVFLRFQNAFLFQELKGDLDESQLYLHVDQNFTTQNQFSGIVFLDGHLTESVEIGLKCIEWNCLPIILIRDQLHPKFLESEINGQFRHFLGVDDDGFCEFLIETVLIRYLRKAFFDLPSFLSHKSVFRKESVRNAQDRSQVRESLIQFVRSFELGLGRSLDGISLHAASVQEELIMNAVWDANPTKMQSDRRVFPSIEERDAVSIEWAFDGHFLAISVSDPFGTFPLSILNKYREFLYSKNQDKMVTLRMDGEGAGIGIFMVLKRVGCLEVSVKEGSRTQVVAYFNLKATQKQASKQMRSLQCFLG